MDWADSSARDFLDSLDGNDLDWTEGPGNIYDPPKPKVPQIPAWEELSAEQQNGLLKVAGRAKFLYEQIRTLTSKEAE